jgi:uncharacterized protein YggE
MHRFFAVIGIVMVCASAASAQGAVAEASVIAVNGVGTVRLGADEAWLSIALEARAAKAVDARNRAGVQMTALQSAIKAAGLPADAIKTSSFSLLPQMEYDYGRVRVREYAARNVIEVRVGALDILGEVFDAAGSLKTPNSVSLTVEGVRFDVKDRAAAEQEALQAALQDALRRAQTIASAAGRTVGGIVRVEEQRFSELPRLTSLVETDRYTMDNQVGARGGGGGGQAGRPVFSGTPVEPNQIEFRAEVRVAVSLR